MTVHGDGGAIGQGSAVHITTADGQPFTLTINITVSMKPTPASSAPALASAKQNLQDSKTAKPNAPSGKAKGKGGLKGEAGKLAKTMDGEPPSKRFKKGDQPAIVDDVTAKDKMPATSSSSTTVGEVWANYQASHPELMESQDADSMLQVGVCPDEAQPDRSLPPTASCPSIVKGVDILNKCNSDDPGAGDDVN